ncbi:MAG: helix-turn-helix domain-containing protein [Clostridiales bacterium]|nr:helix-turn-helix domain-containing protein [Clostridiales bacterium]
MLDSMIYWITSGVLYYAKRDTKQTIQPEFKKLVIETMMGEKLSYCETARRFDVSSDTRIKDWERIYLMEGPEGFTVERRGRGSKGRPKQLPKAVEEDLLAEVQRLRAENEYLKNLQALVLEDERRQRRKRR